MHIAAKALQQAPKRFARSAHSAFLENAESPSLQVQPAMNRENRRAERSKATRGDCILYFFHVRFDLAHGFLRRAVIVRDAVGKGRVERRARVIHRVKIAR